jgi:hypothetical protein
MQPIQSLMQGLAAIASSQGGVFATQDLRALLPNLSDAAFKTLLSRAAERQQAGVSLRRVCRGVYVYGRAAAENGLLLFHAAAVLRANGFNYISLETALSAQGLISQVPINWVSIMSSGRSSIVPCGLWGTIEFVHTTRQPNDLAEQLHYDAACRLWCASPALALRDMRATRRSLDLVDSSAFEEDSQ